MEEKSVQEVKKTKKKSKTDWLGSIGLTLILTAVVLIVWYFLSGQTTVTGDYPEGTKSPSLSCLAEGVIYPIFTVDETTNKKTEVKVLFGNEKMKSISLFQTMYYPNIEMSGKSEAHNHAAMNKSFAAAGLDVDSFNANYSAQNDKMVMTLYANGSEFNRIAARYFLANGLDEESSIDEFTEVYTSQGFNCVISK